MPTLRQRPMMHGPNLRRRGGGGDAGPSGLYANLWAYWPHEDGAGSAVVDVHSTHDLSGGALLDVAGIILRGLWYPASQQSVTGPPIGPWSISGWLNPTGGNNNGIGFRLFDGAVAHWFSMIGGTNTRLHGQATTDDGPAGSTDYSHYVITSDGNLSLNFYVDGALGASVTASAALTGSPVIWLQEIEGSYWDEVGFWTEEFVLAQVQRLYNGGAGLPYSDFG